MRTLAVVAVLAACSGEGSDAFAPDAGDVEAADAAVFVVVDEDHDGLDDAWEQQLAESYLPFISLDPEDGCPLSGLVARVRPHPLDASKVLIVYSHLFERDCGINGHVGDNEAFGIAIDPQVPAPAGILSIRTASHQKTICERVTECSTCGASGIPACDVAADGATMWPVLYASKGKHGQYASLAQCPFLGTCLDVCTLAATRVRPPVINVGEPGAPLVRDLSTHGFITAANGWTEPELMNHDPWSAQVDFGAAGNVADDLDDPEFVAGLCG